MTSGSAASSRSSASRIAATKPSVRRVDRRKQVIGTRVLVAESCLDRHFHLGLDLSSDRGSLPLVELAALAKYGLETRQRILGLPLRDHGGVSNIGKIRPHRMLHASECLHLEERRTGAGTSSVQRPGNRILDRQ